jgi:hypothetical protein
VNLRRYYETVADTSRFWWLTCRKETFLQYDFVPAARREAVIANSDSPSAISLVSARLVDGRVARYRAAGKGA